MNYWIKLYQEILDDPKMATLPDRLWRRIIELFLIAGRTGDSGMLPDTNQIAWILRMKAELLQVDMNKIEATGIIQKVSGGWLILQFAKRQSPSTSTERSKIHRETEKKRQYYGDCNENATKMQRNVAQINRLTDTDTDTEQKASLNAKFDTNNPFACK